MPRRYSAFNGCSRISPNEGLIVDPLLVETAEAGHSLCCNAPPITEIDHTGCGHCSFCKEPAVFQPDTYRRAS